MSLYRPAVAIPVYSVLAGVGIATTGVRLWVRTRVARVALGLDDLFVVLGGIVAAACTAMQYYNAIHGSGGEATDSSTRTNAAVAAHKIDWAMIVIEKPAFGFVKLSILFFYGRIFDVWPSFRRINSVMICIAVVWMIGFTVADVLLCGAHPELNWAVDQTVSRKKCGQKGILLLSFAVTSVATDWVLLVLPLFYIGHLQMSMRKKLSSGFVFFLGMASTTASILRLIFLSIALPTGRLEFAYLPPAKEKTPLVLQVFNPTFWVMVELWLGIWAANLPPCSPLLRGLHPYQLLSRLYRRTTSRLSSEPSASKERV
ncbi:hypothetical protein PG996_010669 [Apiospora saccharicola]|uniref:Rhodopsin domain-containing protein n=1 Tax=Apiospora saccharicola TaxID=335842 RepID=A0ABR1USC0_9PEZI